MVKPKLSKESAVRIHAINVRSAAMRVRVAARLVAVCAGRFWVRLARMHAGAGALRWYQIPEFSNTLVRAELSRLLYAVHAIRASIGQTKCLRPASPSC
jgi:hypothetical protein